MRPGASAPASMEALREQGERLMQALSREHYLSLSGHKPTADLQRVFDEHPAAATEESLAMAREAFLAATPGSDERHTARLMLEWQAELGAARELAPLDERIFAWEASAVVRVEGESMEYERAAIEIANSADRPRRLAIEGARDALVAAELAPLRRERLARERELTEELDVADGVVATFELLSGVDLATLADQCRAFLRDTESMWLDVIRDALRTRLGIDPRDARRSDALALLRGKAFDAHFPGSEMQSRVARQVEEMGIDLLAAGRVILDTEDRPGKRSRAFCAPVRIPDEVYLVLRPHGGQTDWTTFLHELGHALHYANVSTELPFEHRWLGDSTVTESYAMLFDHLMKDGGWLARYTDLGRPRVREFRRSAALEELQMLRRYSAKLLYELELYAGEVSWAELPDRYVELLSGATTFRYDASGAFVDVDARFYSSRYLRAWQLQAGLTETLTERFDADWWRNPRAGPWIVGTLFAEGQREDGAALAERITGRGLEFGPLIRAIEGALA